MTTKNSLPRHVAIIPDGNRRWAKEHGLTVLEGHRYVGEKIFPRLIKHAIDRQISYLTFWVFSRENWQRSQSEVDGLMMMFKQLGVGKLIKESARLGARIKVIGRSDDFTPDLQTALRQAEEKTQANDKIVVTLGLSYSGRDELTRALERIKASWQQQPDLPLTEDLIAQALDTAQEPAVPDPDLIIRTSGEQRLSGFMPWQSTYSEFYFTATKMPDFAEAAFDLALEEYARRQRRFGE